MHTEPFYINNTAENDCPTESVLSFRPFIDYLENKIATDTSIKVKFYKHAYKQIITQLENSHAATSAELQNSTEIMELMFATLSPILTDEEEYIWALSTPVPNKIFYSTDAFYNLIINKNPNSKNSVITKRTNCLRKSSWHTYIN